MTANQKETDAARGHLTRLVFGHMGARVLATAVRLGVLDRFTPGAAGDAGGRTATEVASDLGTHPPATLRLLRALAALELLTETSPGRFALTTAGGLLHSSSTSTSSSMAAFVRMFTDPVVLSGWDHLADSVRTGDTSFERVFGMDCFAYMKENPALAEEFNAAMSQGTNATAVAVAERYDFGRFMTVVDVGGGDGTLLAAVLRRHAAPRGIVFDTAEGIGQADATLTRAGVAGRCTLEAGDFGVAVPSGGDLYLLKSVVYDWDDDRCTTILGHVRKELPADGRLLVIEPVLPPTVGGTIPATAYLSDLNMLVNTGGRARTRADFEDLFQRSGFELTEVIPLPPPSPFAIIEAVPV